MKSVEEMSVSQTELNSQLEPNSEGEVYIAPRNSIELQLAQIWEQVLEIQPISIIDNYFDLGGDSLRALRLFDQIEQTFGKKLSLATLIQAPTLEQLAEVIGQESESVSFRSLVPIQPSGSKPPLFCMHGNGAHVLAFQDLAQYLGADQPFYGLQARGVDGVTTPLNRIEDMAAAYIEEIRAVQPKGPFYLAGFSSGGVVAFEMAKQLHAKGEEVAFVGLLDTFVPGCFKKVTVPEWFSRQWRNFFRFGLKHPVKIAYRSLERKVYVVYWSTYLKLAGSLPYFWHRKYVGYSIRKAMRTYTFQPYAGKLTLFRATEVPGKGWYYYPSGMPTPDDWYTKDPEYGWGDLAEGGLEAHDLPGNHSTILKEPHIEILSKTLEACLEKARSEVTVEELSQA